MWRVLCASGIGIADRVSTLDHGGSIFVSQPRFWGFGAAAAVRDTPARRLNLPTIAVLQIPHVVVVGGIDYVFRGREAYHSQYFRPGEQKCPAENVGVIAQDAFGKNCALHLTKKGTRISTGVMLIGQSSRNYAHWLTEVLPKLAVLEASMEEQSAPLLVDSGLHENLLASIDIVNRCQRPVVIVDRWTAVEVDRLTVVTQPGYERYIPYRISTRPPPPYSNEFSRFALRLMRDAVWGAIGEHYREGPKHLYLGRNEKSANMRCVANWGSVRTVIEKRRIGHYMVDSMTFGEQVAAVHAAELIVAPVGAALANMIFAPEGCRVVALAPYYEGASYSYFTNLAGVLGHDLRFVLGQPVGRRGHPMQRNYWIEEKDVVEALS